MIWPRIAGVVVAIGAQAGLYLALRHLATATMPAWAHHRPAGPMPWPAMVPVDVVPGTAGTADRPAPMRVPPFGDAPVVVVAPPPLGAFDAPPPATPR